MAGRATLCSALVTFAYCVWTARSMADDVVSCNGPIQSHLKFGCTSSMAMAKSICCHNTEFAEPSGYFETVGGAGGLFGHLNASGVAIFYDSVCGKPLFQAPIGRSFAAWKAESEAHGWPSFRPAELIKDNVVILPSGEMRSVCGTHLGHNLPDGIDDRYCIDLVCIAGFPQESSSMRQSSSLSDTTSLASFANPVLDNVHQKSDSKWDQKLHGANLPSNKYMVYFLPVLFVSAAFMLGLIKLRQYYCTVPYNTVSEARQSCNGVELTVGRI